MTSFIQYYVVHSIMDRSETLDFGKWQGILAGVKSAKQAGVGLEF